MYSIGLASKLSGVPAETIRVWERRYQLPQPARSVGGHRQYSKGDLELLRALKTLIDAGARIGTLAQQPREELLRAAKLAASGDGEDRALSSPSDFREMVEELVDAARRCDSERAEEILDRPLLHRHAREVVLGLYLPLLREVGELWFAGELTVASEHFAEKLISGRIYSVFVNQPSREGPEAVCACLPKERHEVGLLAAAVLLKDAGFKVTYLGADLPLSELRNAVNARRPRLVVIAATIAPTAKVAAELREALTDPRLKASSILVGGAGMKQLELGDDVTYIDDLAELVDLADSLARAS